MRKWAGVVLAVALVFGASACGGGDDDPKDESNGQEATEFGDLKPEDVRASPAEVADGFRELNRYVAEVLTKLDGDDKDLGETQERLLTIWESILGTVKANDEAAYAKLDGALQTLMTVGGPDKVKAQEAADLVKEIGEAYLAEFPATGSAPPESTSSPSADSGSDIGGDSADEDPPLSY